jgi:hypothetical protein
LPATTIKQRRFFSRTVLFLIIFAPGVLLHPVHAGVGEGISRTETIDTQPPYIIVDQFPEFSTFQGGDIVPFHWQSGDHNPGTVPEYFTATVWIDGQADSTIIYYPETADFTWEWTVPEVSSANVHLEVLAGDAFGNSASGTTNSFTVLPSVTCVPRVPGELRLATPAPNPFNPSTRLIFHLPEPGRVALTVYDARGRRVRTLLRGHRLGGEFEAHWDGRDDRGRAQSGGVYLLVLDFHGSSQSGRISQKTVLIP